MGRASERTLSVVMPAYQLGDAIEGNIATVFEVLAPLEPQVIVVDDGSTDDTWQAISRAAERAPDLVTVRLSENRGKGRALLSGWQEATGDDIVFLDADLDLPPDQIPDLLERLDDADIVVGTKRTSMAGGAYPGVRRILSRVFALLTGGMFRLPVSETQTGLKAFRREVLDEIADKVRIDRYAFDIELLVRAHAAGFVMVEAPVRLGSGAAESSLRPSMMWNLAIDTARIAWWRLTEPGFKR
ncbi:MAG TPA: glycosyltransferase family 2 protein [Acidimicrobiia bacterium]|jgi:glycosyltransferase involved in cell wall biosynthesis